MGSRKIICEVTPALEVLSLVPSVEDVREVLPTLKCVVSMTRIAHPPVSMMRRMKCSPRRGNLWGSFHLHKTAAYQAGHIWRQALQPAPVLPSTCD